MIQIKITIMGSIALKMAKSVNYITVTVKKTYSDNIG